MVFCYKSDFNFSSANKAPSAHSAFSASLTAVAETSPSRHPPEMSVWRSQSPRNRFILYCVASTSLKSPPPYAEDIAAFAQTVLTAGLFQCAVVIQGHIATSNC
jgi:hypothetical protein